MGMAMNHASHRGLCHGALDGFRRGLARTAEWFSDPANLARYRPGSYTV